MKQPAQMPQCPSCHQRLGWKESFTFWNPWKYDCPHCRQPLEASRIQKVFAFATVPAGIALAAIPIACQEMGLWHQQQSLVYFAVVLPMLIAAALLSWPMTRFKIKAPR